MTEFFMKWDNLEIFCVLEVISVHIQRIIYLFAIRAKILDCRSFIILLRNFAKNVINFYYNTKLLKRGDLNFEMVYLVRHWWLQRNTMTVASRKSKQLLIKSISCFVIFACLVEIYLNPKLNCSNKNWMCIYLYNMI